MTPPTTRGRPPAGPRLRAAGLLVLCWVATGCGAPLAGTASPAAPAPPAGTVPVTAHPPAAPEGPVERLPPGVHRTAVAGQEAVVVVPDRSNGGLVVYLHGYRGDARALQGEGPLRALVDGLVAAGYAVAAGDAGGDAWGSAASVDAHAALAATARARTGARDVFLVADSMGGLAGAQLVTQRRVAGLRGYAAISPLCDLSSVQPGFRQSIEAAHGPGVPDALAALSPVTLDAPVPVVIWASEEDTTVVKERNADVCAAQVLAGGGAATVVRTRGRHGDPSGYDLPGLLAFLAAAAG